MTDAIRVLWLTPDKPANVSVGRQRIADHLSTAGFEVTLRGTTPRTLFRSLRERDRYDVVLGTTRLGAVGGVLFKLAAGTPLVVDHVDPIRQFATNNPRWRSAVVRRLESAAFRVADHVLYVYPEEAARVRRHAPATETDLGVEYERFANPDEAVVERAETALAECAGDDRVAVYVGGLEPIYHVPELLDAAERLDGWTLVVLGAGSLSGLVERAASERENVAFPGTVPHEEIPGYLRAADVGVCLVDDPHTLKVLEYGAAGLPTVQVRGLAEERFDGLVEFCDPEPDDIARAMERADESRSGETLQEYAADFHWAAIAETYAGVLERVLR